MRGQRHVRCSAGRGDLSALDLLPSLAPHAAARGHGGAVRRLRDHRPATATAATCRPLLTAYDDVVSSVGGMWANKDFQARIRLSALVLGHVADAAGSTGSQDRGRLVGRADELLRGCPAGGPAA